MNNIKELEKRVNETREAYEQAKKEHTAALKIERYKVKPGSFIKCINSVEWAYTIGDRMRVDSVHESHVMARPANPQYGGIYWVTNSDWVLDNA